MANCTSWSASSPAAAVSACLRRDHVVVADVPGSVRSGDGLRTTAEAGHTNSITMIGGREAEAAAESVRNQSSSYYNSVTMTGVMDDANRRDASVATAVWTSVVGGTTADQTTPSRGTQEGAGSADDINQRQMDVESSDL